MSNKKIIMKINRYTKHIGKDDLILDNGSCIQVTTQTGASLGWGQFSYLQMSKKLFKDLKTCGFIFVDEIKTKKANEPYDKPFLTYYRFDIDRMITNGYEVVGEDG
jgi:hypothetical protein